MTVSAHPLFALLAVGALAALAGCTAGETTAPGSAQDVDAVRLADLDVWTLQVAGAT